MRLSKSNRELVRMLANNSAFALRQNSRSQRRSLAFPLWLQR